MIVLQLFKNIVVYERCKNLILIIIMLTKIITSSLGQSEVEFGFPDLWDTFSQNWI